MAKMGRPTKLTQEVRDTIMAMSGAGKTDKEIAQAVGINECSIHRWKLMHEDFSKSLKNAKTFADDLVEASLLAKATGYEHEEVKVFCHEGMITEHTVTKHYPPSDTSMIFWLKNRRPDKWRDRVEVAEADIDEMEFKDKGVKDG